MAITRKHFFSFLFLTIFSLVMVLPLISRPMLVQAQAPVSSTLFNSQEGIEEVGQVYGNQRMDVRLLVVKIIQIGLGFLATIFLVLTLYAGFKYMTSGGNEEKAREAIKLLTNAIIGLVIILLAWAITKFVLLRMAASINNNVNPWYPY